MVDGKLSGEITALALVLAALPTAGQAQVSYPTTGIVYHTTERSSLTFDCNKQGERLHCQFVQTWIRKDLDDSDVERRRAELLVDFESAVTDLTKDGACNELAEAIEILDGKRSAPDQRAIAATTAAQRATLRRHAVTVLEFCETPDRDHYAQVVDSLIEQETRSCRVGGIEFEQSFIRPAGQDEVWVVDAGTPEGQCGIINLSRFERPDDNTGTGLGPLFWRYVSRKAITNPAASAGLLSCSDLDEGQYVFDWKSIDHFVDCDVVRFSVF